MFSAEMQSYRKNPYRQNIVLIIKVFYAHSVAGCATVVPGVCFQVLTCGNRAAFDRVAS